LTNSILAYPRKLLVGGGRRPSSRATRSADRYAATRNGKSVRWKRLYRPLGLKSEGEDLVFLVAHEAFHYLKTGQVAGWHGEIEADAFALKVLEQYRDEPK
jgi:hypothetical protein